MLNIAETGHSRVSRDAEMPCGQRRCLLSTTTFLGVLTVLHDIDHVRQGRTLPVVLYGVALFALLTIAVVLALLLRRHRFAGISATAQGVATIVGVGAVHVAPQWSSLSDSYAAAHADALSWAIILAMMFNGLALALWAASSARREWHDWVKDGGGGEGRVTR